MSDTAPAFIEEPDPDNPGWTIWRISDERRFNAQIMGKIIVKMDSPGQARMRMFPEMRHTNLMGNLHGGTILSLIDVSVFGCSRMLGIIEAGTAVTLDMSVQFIGAGTAEAPLDSVAEMLKETRRLVFLRGLVEQGDNRIAAFSATIRKPTAK